MNGAFPTTIILQKMKAGRMTKQLPLFGPDKKIEEKPKEEVRYTDLPVYPINNFNKKEKYVCIEMFLAVSDVVGQGHDKLQAFQNMVRQVKQEEIPCPAKETCQRYACAMAKPHQIKLGSTK